jgi:hypothetical protein
VVAVGSEHDRARSEFHRALEDALGDLGVGADAVQQLA